MMNPHAIVAVLVSALFTFGLRALPFIAFAGDRKMPGWMEQLGQMLPSAIMAVLILYCLRDIKTDWIGVGIPRLFAVAVVAVTYKLRHNTFFSITAGTACYMLLLRLM